MDQRPGAVRRSGHPRRHGVRDQARTGAADDHPGTRCRDPGRLGGRRRGVRRRPPITSRDRGTRGELCAGRGQKPSRRHHGRCAARGRARRETAAPGLAAHRWLLIRRHRRTRELAYYRCYSPRHVPLTALVQVAGQRWAVEEDFQAGKGLAGLDEHQVRRWTSWYRWVTLAMLACALLSVAALTERTQRPAPAGMIPLTRNEIAHLTATVIIQPAADIPYRLRWSAWRRRHQHTARTCHYRRQAAKDP